MSPAVQFRSMPLMSPPVSAPGAGFVAIDLGDLVTGAVMQQVRGPLAGVNLIQL